MSPATREQINAHAIREFPREACGLIVELGDGTQQYMPCRNIAVTANEHFALSAEDYADAEDMGTIICVVHSHPNVPARPSQGDKVACEKSKLAWMIVAVWKQPGDAVPVVADSYYMEPSGYEAPLVGREFFFGILDCYTLIKDWYKRERGVELPEFERHDNFWKGGNAVDLYAQYEKAGFYDIGQAPMEVGDVVLMQIRAPFANHAGIYLGDNMLLHHLYGHLSKRDPYSRSYYHETTRRVVRYRG